MGRTNGVRMGELLVEARVLTCEQVEAILAEQKSTARPFGDLAERMFNVSPESIEQAWIDQYLAYGTEVDLDTQRIDIEVLSVLNRRQAWQFRMLPLRREHDEIVTATTREDLPRAVNFAWRRMTDPVFLVIAKRPQLEQFLMSHYPWPAMAGGAPFRASA